MSWRYRARCMVCRGVDQSAGAVSDRARAILPAMTAQPGPDLIGWVRSGEQIFGAVLRTLQEHEWHRARGPARGKEPPAPGRYPDDPGGAWPPTGRSGSRWRIR